MQAVATGDIVKQLFEEYYVKSNIDADSYTSSHWQELHKNVNVVFDADNVALLAGTGFGDLQNRSLVYRCCSAMTILCYLIILKQRGQLIQLFPEAVRLSKKIGLYFTYDAFRQVCVLAALEPYLKKPGVRVIIIGDGYGFLSALIKNKYPQAKISLLDLGKTLLFQAYDCQKAFTQAQFHLVTTGGTIPANADFVFCPTEDLECLSSQEFDIVINVASMQEMNSQTIKRYFDFLRRTIAKDGVFYCCNREEKIMPGGEVARLNEYPWDKDDQFVWDEVCPWYRFFLSFQRGTQGPKIGKIRIPLINYFDGVVRHRLVKFAKTSRASL